MVQVGLISVHYFQSERNGKNIDFRTQQHLVLTSKLDVNNNYIGINKTAPALH